MWTYSRALVQIVRDLPVARGRIDVTVIGIKYDDIQEDQLLVLGLQPGVLGCLLRVRFRLTNHEEPHERGQHMRVFCSK